MKEVHGHNPAEEWLDEELKRRFSNFYAEVHIHGTRGGAKDLAYLWAMEQELMNRGIDPSETIGPKVI